MKRVLKALWTRVDAWSVTARIRHSVDRHPKSIAASFFLGGFVWDYLTLTRVDAVFDNLLLLLYVLVVSVLGYYIMLGRSGAELPRWVKTGERWLPLAMQFAFGALFSANVIFYWQSTTLTAGASYFLMLVVLLVANEFVSHDRSPVVLFAMLFVGSHSFFMYMVPVALGRMGFAPFLLAGLLGMGLCGFIGWRLSKKQTFPSRKNLYGSIALIVSLFVLSIVFYLNRLIPPVPLAVRDVGVFHSVERQDSRFVLAYEPAGQFLRQRSPSRVFHLAPGGSIYCFASVFAPRRFKSEVFHVWYSYDDRTGEWVLRDRIGYSVAGGRQNGFRGYTVKQNVEQGSWRIDVETDDRFVIGRLYFRVIEASAAERDLRVRFK